MHIQFTAVRRGVTIVPAFDPRVDVPQAQMQSAIVVGPKGEEVHCDQLGRVKIRFPGTRPEDHEEAASAGASNTSTDSAWVRVASNWAGADTFPHGGSITLPRVGTEVVVNFLGGDPDKPLIIAQVYNQRARPPAFSKMGDLPGNRYVAGIRSREMNGSRGNQLRLDDTNGEISAQLASEHGDSQLNLGYLTQPRVDGTAEQRGEGAELRSEMAVALRGAAGVLITASPGGGTTGKQLERGELNRVVSGLQKLSEQLSTLAERYAAEQPHGPELVDLAERISELHEGGMQLVAIDGPMGVAMTSGQNLLLGAVTDIDIVSSADTYLSAGGSGAWRVARSLGFFANQGDVKITAASAKVEVQAQNSAMTLLAKKVIEIMSTTDWINITAKQGVRISGGGSELVISADGIKGYTSGKHEMHAADHQTMGASSKEVQFPGSKVCPTRTASAAQSGGAAVPLSE
jgi:type VI secretion system secreted protein VgrG